MRASGFTSVSATPATGRSVASGSRAGVPSKVTRYGGDAGVTPVPPVTGPTLNLTQLKWSLVLTRSPDTRTT